MYSFGEASKGVLLTCHPDIRVIMAEGVKILDMKPYEGIRLTAKQMEYFAAGKSTLDGVTKLSKHQGRKVPDEVYEADKAIGDYSFDDDMNPIISYALDVAPYPIDWADRERFYYMGGLLIGIADKLYAEGRITHKLRWGGDWDRDGKFKDQTFDDLPHVELIKP